MCKEFDKPNQCDKSCLTCVAHQSDKSYSRPCIANPNINCNCYDTSRCAELGNDPDNTTDLADKINCIGNPYPKVERKDSTPCVVFGAIF